MATKSLAELFSIGSLPASGGFGMQTTTPSSIAQKKKLTTGSGVPAPSPAYTPPKPIVYPAGSPLYELGKTKELTPSGVLITKKNTAPVVNPSANPLFGNGGAGNGGETGDAPPDQNPMIPPQWLKADGSFKTPDEIANEVGGAIGSAHGNGDIGTLALEQFGGNGKSAVELEADARRIGNTRNDIAVGETDPYKVASQSGIAYTAAELSAIEKAYAGIYDPALDTALAKVNAKQNEKPTEGFTLGKDQVRYDADGNPIAVGISSDDGTGGGTYKKGANAVVDAYVDGFKNGTYKATDIPDQYKDLVAQGVKGSAPAMTEAAKNALSNVNLLLTSDLKKVTGASNLNPLTFVPGSDSAPVRNLLSQLAGTLALKDRQQLKGSGAISDFEFRVLQQAASAMGVNDNGTSNLSEAALKKELQKLQLKLEVGETTLTDDELMHLKDIGYPVEDIRQAGQETSFNDVGNTTASTGNRPQRNNNPGNVKEGGLADSLAVGKDEQGHLIFPDAATGFKALTADVTAKINGGSTHVAANPTLRQLGKVYAEDPNWPIRVAQIIGVDPDTHTKNIPIANLVKAIATQEGFYA